MASNDEVAERIAVVGATGRLGRALGRLGSDAVQLGVGRHPTEAAWPEFVVGDAGLGVTWDSVFKRADAVIHLCAFDAADAAVACDQAEKSGFSGPLLFASSLAERPPALWTTPATAAASDDPWPDDSYGQGKRRARAIFEQRWPGAVVSLLLPGIVAADDLRSPFASYIDQARAEGGALLPGSGQQQLGHVTAGDVAAICVRLLTTSAPSGPLQVGPRAPQPLVGLVTALLIGAGTPAEVQPHPDPTWRGPHSGADEIANTARLQAALGDFAWADLRQEYAALGRNLARGRRSP